MSKRDKNILRFMGELAPEIVTMLDNPIPHGAVYQSDGLVVHIRKRHPDILHKMHLIPDILANPDFIGKDPTKPNSIELIKVYDRNMLISITLDTDDDYLYVSSIYDINQSKLERRINSGRLLRYSNNPCKHN